ncbi:MAG: hypothetical protein V2B15_07825 [Bacteroidota bacterium]
MIAASIDDNIDRMKSDLVSRGLTYERLMDDILDHVCCMVEENMQEGFDFDSSYERVMGSIGENHLPEIQHQTLLNLDKKYQRMKNFTYVFGLSSALLAIVGAFFKRMHWPGAGILITVGIVLVVLVFLPLYFITSHREQVEKKNPIYAIVGYLTIALLLAGALFKLMHWPGAGMMIQVGIGFLIVGFIPLYVVNAFQKGGKKKVQLPYIVMLLVGVSVVMLMTNVRISKEAINIYMEEVVSNEQYLGEITKRTDLLMEMTRDSTYADKQSQVFRIHEKAGELQLVVDELRESLLQSVDQPGTSIQEVKGKDKIIHRKGWDATRDLDKEEDFIRKARGFRDMLDDMLLDPVIRCQIEDHMEFTKKVRPYEFGERFATGEPLIFNYYMLTKISKEIALTEFVSIQYILRH